MPSWLRRTNLGLAKKPKKLSEWKTSHQPFHWFVEFYDIMSNGGFDVIIGNPPYVEYSKVRSAYTVHPTTVRFPAATFYALVLERCYHSGSEERMAQSYRAIEPRLHEQNRGGSGTSEEISGMDFAYDMWPSSLFEGVAQRLSILVAQNRWNGADTLFIGGYRRWMAEERPFLIPQTTYVPLPVSKGVGPFPKLSQAAEPSILAKIAGTSLAQFSDKISDPIFVHRIVRYFAKALNFVPLFIDARGKRGKSEDYKEFRFASEEQEQITALLNSTLFYWFWRSHCDGFHCGYNDVYSMPYKKMTESANRNSLRKLVGKLMKHLQDGSEERRD